MNASERLRWLPETGVDQSCAVCDAESPSWLHPLAPDRVRFRIYGKGHTLPGFWILCTTCEAIYQAGDREALLERMKAGWAGFWTDAGEELLKPLDVFIGADEGGRRLPA